MVLADAVFYSMLATFTLVALASLPPLLSNPGYGSIFLDTLYTST
jgi:uncharacterized membrane protein